MRAFNAAVEEAAPDPVAEENESEVTRMSKVEAGVPHRYGPYGGQYVPETLMPALAELEAQWIATRDDPGYRAELEVLLRDYCGRPTPLYLAERLSELAGRELWLKREDLMHTGSHKLNNALGQALLARRMGKRRVIAETGAGQHGVASATAAALLDLECVVYMGSEDTRRQAPNVERMRLLGATVVPVEAGQQDAEGGDVGGDPRLGHERRVDALHHRLGRRPGAVSGARARPAARHRRRGARGAPRAHGAAARPGHRVRRGRLERDGDVRAVRRRSGRRGSIGVEAAGEGIETGRHGAPLTVGGRAGVLHGALSAVMQDEDGQITEAHSVSAGLDYPGTGPEHAWLRDSGRASYVAVSDEQADAAFREVARLEGIIPALETSHALHYAVHEDGGGSTMDLLCCSGRGDKDLAEVLARGGD